MIRHSFMNQWVMSKPNQHNKAKTLICDVPMAGAARRAKASILTSSNHGAVCDLSLTGHLGMKSPAVATVNSRLLPACRVRLREQVLL